MRRPADSIAEGTRLACALGLDPTGAEQLARRAWTDVLARWHDVRHPSALEAEYLRRLVRIATRRRPLEEPTDQLATAFRRLSARSRAFLALSFYAELSDQQIGDIWGCSPNTVRADLARGLARLPGSDPKAETIRLLRERAALAGVPDIPPVGGLWLRRIAYVMVLLVGTTLTGTVLYMSLTKGIEVSGGLPVAAENSPPSSGDPGPYTMPACLDPSGTQPATQRFAAGANRAAIEFARALGSGDAETVDGLIDPSAASIDVETWGRPATTRGLHVTGSRSAESDGLAILACGREVAARSWKVYIHDGSNTASAGLAVYYLARRPEGWLVWGSYKPGA